MLKMSMFTVYTREFEFTRCVKITLNTFLSTVILLIFHSTRSYFFFFIVIYMIYKYMFIECIKKYTVYIKNVKSSDRINRHQGYTLTRI